MDTSYQNGSDERVNELLLQIRELEQKVARLQRERGVYAAKTRLLTQELEKYHSRELRQDTTVDSLLERQREMHVMLNRSNIMLAKAQNATAMLSLEFGELARALPETIAGADDADPMDAEAVTCEIDDRIRRINDLFRKTGELSEEIAETLQSSQQAAASAPTQDSSAPVDAQPYRSAQPSAPPGAAEPQRQPWIAADEHTEAQTASSHAEPPPAQAWSQAAAAQPEQCETVEAIYEVTEEDEQEGLPDGDGVDHTAVLTVSAAENSETNDTRVTEQAPADEPATDTTHSHDGVPPPQDIFIADSVSSARMGYRRAPAGSRSGSRASHTEDTDTRSEDGRETQELLDKLEQEQQSLDKGERTRPRKSFWTRLLGG